MLIEEILGWIGTTTYLVAYILLTVKIIAMERLYLYLNLIAASLIIIVSIAKSSWFVVALDLFWAAITLTKLINYSVKLPARSKIIFQIIMGVLLSIGLNNLLLKNYHFGISILASCSTIGYSFSYLLFLNRLLKVKEFHFWNFLLAIILIPQLVLDNNWQVITIQIFWSAIALWGIANGNYYKKANL